MDNRDICTRCSEYRIIAHKQNGTCEPCMSITFLEQDVDNLRDIIRANMEWIEEVKNGQNGATSETGQ